MPLHYDLILFVVKSYFILKFDFVFVKNRIAVEVINPFCFYFPLLCKFFKLRLTVIPLDEIRIAKRKSLRNSAK